MDNKSNTSSIFKAYESHVSSLKSFVSRLLNDKKDVDDVVQEAFLRAYAAEKKKPILQPKSYLFRVSKNVALTHLREKTRKPTDYLEDFTDSSVLLGNDSLEDEVIAHQTIGIHCEAVASLAPKCRKVYLMRKAYGMSYKEIAKALGISVSTVETHLERGFAQCDAYIEDSSGEQANSHSQRKQKRDVNHAK